MSRKRTILLFALLMHAFFAPLVSAVPAEPVPSCEITANVLNVEKKDEESRRFVINRPPDIITYYSVKLDILSKKFDALSGFKPDNPAARGYCNDGFLGRVAAYGGVYVYATGHYDQQPILSGQKISASVQFGGDEFFNGLFLSDVRILGDQ